MEWTIIVGMKHNEPIDGLAEDLSINALVTEVCCMKHGRHFANGGGA